MWKAFSGRSESGSTSGLRRKKSGSGRAGASDAGVSSTSRRDEEGRRGHKSSRSAYGDDDGKSSASVYATAPSSRVGSSGGRGLTESAVRALGSQDEDWEDDDRAKSEKRSRRGEGSERRHKSGRSEKERSQSRERKERRRESTSYRDSGRDERSHGNSRTLEVVDGPNGERGVPAMGSFEQFPGQYTAALVGPVQPHDPVMSGALPSADPMHQFPSQIPSTYSRPQLGPTRADSYGQASEYYMDEGQSVHTQPGHRAGTPNMLVNPDTHLMAASAVPQPAQDTGHGSAADFYGGKVSPVYPEPAKPTPTSSQRPLSGRRPLGSTSRPSKLGAVASTAAAAAATAGVIRAPSSSHQQTSSTSYQKSTTSSRPPAQSSQRSPDPSFTTAGAAGSYYAPAPQQVPLSQQGTSSKQPSRTNSNVPLYAAGAAAAGAAAYGMSQQHQQTSSNMESTSYYGGGGGGQGPPRPPLRAGDGSYMNGGSGMQPQQYHYHEHKGPITRLKDGFLNLIWNPEDVRRMEEYTEYIGVCKYCFDPRSTPNDGPRQHHFHRRPSQDSFEELRRRKSYERMQRMGSSETLRRRVDKDNRYYSSEREKRRTSGKAEMVGAGLAAAGVAAGASALFNERKDFDDTYSVKSGHRASSALRRRSRSSSRERRRRSEHGIVRAEPKEEYVTVRTKDGRVERRQVMHSERSDGHERRDGLMGAAAGAAIGAAAASAMVGDSRRRHDSQLQGAFVRRHSGSRSRSHSPGLGEIFGLSARKPSRSGRQSPNGSYYDVTQRERRGSGQPSGMLGSFFSPSQNERKRRDGREHPRKQKGFFGLGNGSSTSSDDDIAFGEGFASKTSLPLRRKTPRRAVRKRSDDHLAATVAGIGITAAALAAAQKGQKISKRTSRPELGARRDVRVQHDGHQGHGQVDEDGWEDELPSDVDDASSTHSGLAFGGGSRLSHRQSFESVSSGDGLSAWGWRWGGKDQKKRRTPSPPHPPYPPRPSDSYVGSVGAGLASGAVAGVAHEHESTVASTPSGPQQPMQYIDPRPMSETGSRHGSMPGSFEPSEARPGPAPLQQPQPIAPISPAFVQDAFLDERPKPRRTASSPTRSSFGLQDAALIGAGALAAGSIIASQGRKGKESSNVRFGLTDEQKLKEDRQRRRERQDADEERRRADRTRALKEEAERHAKEEDAGRREEEVRRRREDENRLAAEANLERQRAAQREAEQQAELDREREERGRREQQELYEQEQRRLADEARQQEQNRRQWEAMAAEEAAREKQARMQREAQIEADIEAKQRELDEQAVQRRRVGEARLERQRRDEEEASERRRADETRRGQQKLEEERSRRSSSAWAPVAAGAVAAATVGAVFAGSEHGRSREVDHVNQREHGIYPEQQALHHPIADEKPVSYAAKQILPDAQSSGSPIVDDDLFDKDFFQRKRSKSEYARHAELARKAADKVVTDRDVYYQQPAVSQADFFAPKEILSQPSAGKTKVADPYDDNDVHVYQVADQAPRSWDQRGTRTKPAPYGVPSLNVICPTPPPSTPVSVKVQASRQHSTLVQDEDVKPPANERPSKRDRSRSITWGEDRTHVYDPPTPESYQERDSYMYARGGSAEDATLAGAALDEVVVEAAEPGEETRRTAYRADELPLDDNTPADTLPSYRQPFYESASDLGFGRFGVDSPGTEGAPPVRGFVEGETDEPTPHTETPHHMPGAFEDDDYEPRGPHERYEAIEPPQTTSQPVVEPEETIWEAPTIKKDKKKRDKSSKRATAFDSEPSEPSTPAPAEVPLPSYEIPETPREEPSEFVTKKDKKKRDKGLKRADTFDDEPRELPTPVLDDFQSPAYRTAETPQEEPSEYSVSKKDKKKRDKASKRASTFESEPSEPTTPAPVEAALPLDDPTETPLQEADDYFVSKKDKKKRDKASKRTSTFEESSEPSTPAPVETDRTFEEPTETPLDEPDDYFMSKKDKKKREKALKHGVSDVSSPIVPETKRAETIEEPPSTEFTASEPDAPKLSKKEQKKRDKESKFGDFADVATTAVAAGGIAALATSVAPEPDPEWTPPTKKGKKGKKAKEPERDIRDLEPSDYPVDTPAVDEEASAMPGGWRPETPIEPPDPSQSQFAADEPPGAQDADSFADFSSGKSKKKKKKRESGRFNEPAASSPLRSEWNYDDYIGSQGASQAQQAPSADSPFTAEPARYANGDGQRLDDGFTQPGSAPAPVAYEAEQAGYDRAERGPEYLDDDRRVGDVDRRCSAPTRSAAVPSMAAQAERASEDRAERGPEYKDDERRFDDTARYHSPEDARPRSVASEPAPDHDGRRRSSSRKARSEGGFEAGADDVDDRSVAVSEPVDYYDGSGKSKHRSRYEDDDIASVVSSRSRHGKDESPSTKKDKKGGLFGLFSRKSSDTVPLSRQSTRSDEAPLSRTSTRNGDEEDGERKHRRRKHREGSVYDDGDDDTRSVTSESKHRHRHRDEREDDGKDKRRSSRHDGDDLHTRSESGHRHHHRSENDRDDDILSRAGSEGGHRHHHHRRRTGEEANGLKDQSFLGDRVENLPPLPVSPPDSPVSAPVSFEQDHGTPAAAESDTHLPTQVRDAAFELSGPGRPRDLSQTDATAEVDHNGPYAKQPIPGAVEKAELLPARTGNLQSESLEAEKSTPTDDLYQLQALPLSRPASPFERLATATSERIVPDRIQPDSLSEQTKASWVDDPHHLPALPVSRPTSPVEEAQRMVDQTNMDAHGPTLSHADDVQQLPALPVSRPESPVETPERPGPPARPTSTTAIPLRFPFGYPRSPNKERSASFGSPLAQTPVSPSSVPKKPRPSSTEFRPLYLVERNRKPQEIEETLPSLPSSKPSSRASSVHSSEDWHSAAEDPPSPETAKRLTIDTENANIYSYDDNDEYLGSEQATPKASEFPSSPFERPTRQAPQFYTWEDFEQDERLHGYEVDHPVLEAAGQSEVTGFVPDAAHDESDSHEVERLPILPASRPGSPYELEVRSELKAGRSAKAIAAAAMLGSAAVLGHRAFESSRHSQSEAERKRDSDVDFRGALKGSYPLPAPVSHEDDTTDHPVESEEKWSPMSRKPSKRKGKGKSGSRQPEAQPVSADSQDSPMFDTMPTLQPVKTDDFLSTERSVEEGDVGDVATERQPHNDNTAPVFASLHQGSASSPSSHEHISREPPDAEEPTDLGGELPASGTRDQTIRFLADGPKDDGIQSRDHAGPSADSKIPAQHDRDLEEAHADSVDSSLSLKKTKKEKRKKRLTWQDDAENSEEPSTAAAERSLARFGDTDTTDATRPSFGEQRVADVSPEDTALPNTGDEELVLSGVPPTMSSLETLDPLQSASKVRARDESSTFDHVPQVEDMPFAPTRELALPMHKDDADTSVPELEPAASRHFDAINANVTEQRRSQLQEGLLDEPSVEAKGEVKDDTGEQPEEAFWQPLTKKTKKGKKGKKTIMSDSEPSTPLEEAPAQLELRDLPITSTSREDALSSTLPETPDESSDAFWLPLSKKKGKKGKKAAQASASIPAPASERDTLDLDVQDTGTNEEAFQDEPQLPENTLLEDDASEMSIKKKGKKGKKTQRLLSYEEDAGASQASPDRPMDDAGETLDSTSQPSYPELRVDAQEPLNATETAEARDLQLEPAPEGLEPILMGRKSKKGEKLKRVDFFEPAETSESPSTFSKLNEFDGDGAVTDHAEPSLDPKSDGLRSVEQIPGFATPSRPEDAERAYERIVVAPEDDAVREPGLHQSTDQRVNDLVSPASEPEEGIVRQIADAPTSPSPPVADENPATDSITSHSRVHDDDLGGETELVSPGAQAGSGDARDGPLHESDDASRELESDATSAPTESTTLLETVINEAVPEWPSDFGGKKRKGKKGKRALSDFGLEPESPVPAPKIEAALAGFDTPTPPIDAGGMDDAEADWTGSTSSRKQKKKGKHARQTGIDRSGVPNASFELPDTEPSTSAIERVNASADTLRSEIPVAEPSYSEAQEVADINPLSRSKSAGFGNLHAAAAVDEDGYMSTQRSAPSLDHGTDQPNDSVPDALRTEAELTTPTESRTAEIYPAAMNGSYHDGATTTSEANPIGFEEARLSLPRSQVVQIEDPNSEDLPPLPESPTIKAVPKGLDEAIHHPRLLPSLTHHEGRLSGEAAASSTYDTDSSPAADPREPVDAAPTIPTQESQQQTDYAPTPPTVEKGTATTRAAPSDDDGADEEQPTPYHFFAKPSKKAREKMAAPEAEISTDTPARELAPSALPASRSEDSSHDVAVLITGAAALATAAALGGHERPAADLETEWPSGPTKHSKKDRRKGKARGGLMSLDDDTETQSGFETAATTLEGKPLSQAGTDETPREMPPTVPHEEASQSQEEPIAESAALASDAGTQEQVGEAERPKLTTKLSKKDKRRAKEKALFSPAIGDEVAQEAFTEEQANAEKPTESNSHPSQPTSDPSNHFAAMPLSEELAARPDFFSSIKQQTPVAEAEWHTPMAHHSDYTLPAGQDDPEATTNPSKAPAVETQPEADFELAHSVQGEHEATPLAANPSMPDADRLKSVADPTPDPEEDWTATFSTKRSKKDKRKGKQSIPGPSATEAESARIYDGQDANLEEGETAHNPTDQERRRSIEAEVTDMETAPREEPLSIDAPQAQLPEVSTSAVEEELPATFTTKRSKKDKRKGQKTGLASPLFEQEPASATLAGDGNSEVASGEPLPSVDTVPFATAATALLSEAPAVDTTPPPQREPTAGLDDEWPATVITKRSKKDKRKGQKGSLASPAMEEEPQSMAPVNDEVTVDPGVTAEEPRELVDANGLDTAATTLSSQAPAADHVQAQLSVESIPTPLPAPQEEWPATFAVKPSKKGKRKAKTSGFSTPAMGDEPVLKDFAIEDLGVDAEPDAEGISRSIEPESANPIEMPQLEPISTDAISARQIDEPATAVEEEWPTTSTRRSKKGKEQAKRGGIESPAAAAEPARTTAQQQNAQDEAVLLFDTAEKAESGFAGPGVTESTADLDIEPKDAEGEEWPTFSTNRSKKDKRKTKQAVPSLRTGDGERLVTSGGPSPQEDQLKSYEGPVQEPYEQYDDSAYGSHSWAVDLHTNAPELRDDIEDQSPREKLGTPRPAPLFAGAPDGTPPVFADQEAQLPLHHTPAHNHLVANERHLSTPGTDAGQYDPEGVTTRELAMSPGTMSRPVRDIDFAATLAAGLADSGFDPDLVVNDSTFHRRASPPGTLPEADPEEFFQTTTSKRKKKGKQARREDALAETANEQAIEEPSREMNDAQLPSQPADGFDVDVTHSLQQSGFDPALLQQAMSSHDGTSIDGPEDDSGLSFATSRRRKKGKGGKATASGGILGLDTSITHSGERGAAVDLSAPKTDKEVTLEPHVDLPRTLQLEVVGDGVTNDSITDGSIWPAPQTAIEPALASVEHVPVTEETNAPASAEPAVDVDPANTFSIAGDRELDVDEMDRTYSAFKKKDRRKKKKQKAIADAIDRAPTPPLTAPLNTDQELPAMLASQEDAPTHNALADYTHPDPGEASVLREPAGAELARGFENPSSPVETSGKVQNLFPGLARVKRRAPSATSPNDVQAEMSANDPHGPPFTSETSRSLPMPIDGPSALIDESFTAAAVTEQPEWEQSLSPYEQQSSASNLSRHARADAVGLPSVEPATTDLHASRSDQTVLDNPNDYKSAGYASAPLASLAFDPLDRAPAETAKAPAWSFAALDNQFVAPESPVLGMKQHEIARDSGYHEVNTPILNRRSGESAVFGTTEVRPASSRESLRSRRSAEPLHIATDTASDWQLNVPKKRTHEETPDQAAMHSRTPSREVAATPLESTTKNRASYLFQSPPANLREKLDHFDAPPNGPGIASSDYFAQANLEPQPTLTREASSSIPDDSLSTGPLSPRVPLEAIPEEHNAGKRSKDDADIGGPAMIKAIRRTETPQAIRSSKERALSPLRPTVTIPTGTMRASSNPLSTDDLINRLSWPAVDDENSTVNINRSLKRGTPRPALPEPRSPSVMSNFSNASMGQRMKSPGDLRSFSRSSNRSSTPTLRRIDRSLSGDLRAASRRGDAGSSVGARSSPKTIPFEAPPTPPSNDEDVIVAGAAGAAVMADVFVSVPFRKRAGCADVVMQQGYGDARGSQVSPTRPPSVRKRQSMHITDLESKLDQLVSENQALQDAKYDVERNHEATSYQQDVNSQAMREALETRDLQLHEKEVEIGRILAMLQPLREEIDRLNEINGGLTEANRNLVDDTNGRYATLQAEHAQAHEQWQNTSRDLEVARQDQNQLTSTMRDAIAAQIASALADKNAEIRRLREELDIATEQIRSLQVQIQSSKSTEFLTVRDEDYFDGACQKLCQHVQQWVLRFSKLSDNRICRLSTELRDDKIENRLDNAILDGSDADKLLGDRIKRRDVFMSVVMTMVWEFVFTRYLFGMDREQRQKLKTLEKILAETGPPRAIAQWRATTLTLLSKRPDFARQCALDTEAVAHEVFALLSALLPPPSNAEQQLLASLQKVIGVAADLAIEMRTQRAEYIMLPPLQPEYDTNGDLVRKVHFNASLMNERSGLFSSNEGLEQDRAVVKIVLFPLVVKKGDEYGQGEEEIVVCPAQVLVQNDGGKGKKVVRVMSGAMEIDDPRRSRQSLVSTAPGSTAF
ncbi:hypothetical protein B0A55_00273 [Friedmanniomyces simplex]|uniref:Involucrin repeat protein n=1 Tax=Friedmanniomyces simplex TaxID=329884 RepID=A0A4U0Y628_9PEZI|nr:hypothetical protein B0A55_00273 [Friedmanniomyces simplex]